MQDNLLQGNTSEADIEKANRRPANWNYEIGVVLTGFDRLWRSTGNQEYLKYTKKLLIIFWIVKEISGLITWMNLTSIIYLPVAN